MGSLQSLPELDFHISSSCCNAIREDDVDMVQSKKSSWLFKRKEIGKQSKNHKKGNTKLAPKTISIQSKQTDETTISNKTI
jgi:hypothetical protein